MSSTPPVKSKSGQENYPIVEDSIVFKAASCVPLLGIISKILNESSLERKIADTTDVKKLVRLVEVKNHYKGLALIRGFLEIAIIATLLAIGILSGNMPLTIGGVFIAVLLGTLIYQSYGLYNNTEVIKELRKNGLGHLGMQVL